MNSIMKKIITKVRVSLFPTEHDKYIKKWFSDEGDEKLRQEYELNNESLVIDLGGYKGQWASDIYARYCCRVLICEPVKSFADKIEMRFMRNSNIEVFRLALGAKAREEAIALCADGSSVYGTTSKMETIKFEDVAEFFRTQHITNVDLMKVNIEGGEYELLSRILETGLIQKIRRIQVQFHDVVPDSQMRMNSICDELKKTHRPTYQYKFVWENWERIDG